MTIAHDLEYFRPKDFTAALALRAKYGHRAAPLAGGTDLIVRMADGAEHYEVIIDLKMLANLKILERRRDSALVVGALITFSELIDSPLVKKAYPVLWEAARHVASVPIRNRATMSGNICSCVPCMDSAPALMVHEASVLVTGKQGERSIPVAKWFVAPRKTTLQHDELVTGIALPEIGKHGAAYLKMKRYRGEDLSQAGVAVLALPKNQYRIAYGSVGPVPTRATSIEKLLNGKKLTPALLAAAKKLVLREVTPITDIRASREYRMHMCQVMLERGLLAAASRLAGKGPQYGHDLV